MGVQFWQGQDGYVIGVLGIGEELGELWSCHLSRNMSAGLNDETNILWLGLPASPSSSSSLLFKLQCLQPKLSTVEENVTIEDLSQHQHRNTDMT